MFSYKYTVDVTVFNVDIFGSKVYESLNKAVVAVYPDQPLDGYVYIDYSKTTDNLEVWFDTALSGEEQNTLSNIVSIVVSLGNTAVNSGVDEPAELDTYHTTDPTNDDDIQRGYMLSDIWVNSNNGKIWICINNDIESAEWVDITDKYGQIEVINFLNQKANNVHYHVESDIFNLDKYTKAEIEMLLDTKIDTDLIGEPNGVAPLNVNGKINSEYLDINTGLTWKGSWDASQNIPNLADNGNGGSQGDFYIVNVAGSTSVDNISDWNIGDWIINCDTHWVKIDNTDKVSAVNGKTGNVILTKSDIGLSNVTNVEAIPITDKGNANGVATLNASGIVPQDQLPVSLKRHVNFIMSNTSKRLYSDSWLYFDNVNMTGSYDGYCKSKLYPFMNNFDCEVSSISLTAHLIKHDGVDVNGKVKFAIKIYELQDYDIVEVATLGIISNSGYSGYSSYGVNVYSDDVVLLSGTNILYANKPYGFYFTDYSTVDAGNIWFLNKFIIMLSLLEV